MNQDLPSVELRGLRPPPWEERDRYGVLNALVLTIRQVLLSPGQTFGRMPVGLGLVQPLLFAVVLALIGALFDWMWSLTVGRVFATMAPDALRILGDPRFAAAQFLLSPIGVVIQLFLRAGIFHGILVMLGGNRLGFEATFRVVAYSRATRLVSLLPGCGWTIGLIWDLTVTIIGLARIHECTGWKAIVAVLAPVILLVAVGGPIVAMMLGLAAFQ